MANLCAQYLNFKCFDTLHNATENHALVAAGAYAFQEYATLNWIYHTQLIFKLADASYDGEELSALMKCCLLLKSMSYFGQLSEQRRALSPGNIDSDDPDFQAEMSLLRQVYESIYSISDNEHSEGLSPI